MKLTQGQTRRRIRVAIQLALLVALLLAVAQPLRAETVAGTVTEKATAAVAEQHTERIAEQIGDRIVRFHASGKAKAAALPSLALERPWPAIGPAPAAFPVQPNFRTVHGRHAVHIATDPAVSLYGTGEVAGPLLRNGHKTTAWNFDAYGYDESTPHLYQSHPWVLAVRTDGSSFGVLAETSYRCHMDLTGGILFVADGPSFSVIVIERDSPQKVVQALAGLIGTIDLPPLWALGYHQCRYSYTPDSRVLEIAQEFRRRRIPCDVIWLDIDYMDAYRCFTFHPQDFPRPERLMNDLHELDFHTVAIIDPGIKREPGYFVYDSGTQIDAWVCTRLGDTYVGQVWPGMCVFPDFTRRQVRQWWAGLYPDFLAVGLDGVWNDMNEPAVFNVDSKTMPLDNQHRADADLGGPGPHARYHNVFGMQMVRATREGMLLARPERRPFVLSRANFIGGQRYAATWTGDNTASWRHLAISIPMVLNLGLSGQPFSGPDIGGFSGAGSGRMFARWMGFGALLPFARGHTGKGNVDKEPWSFGEEVEETCRRALRQRYLLMPYLYTLFWEASQTGLPVARPVFFADPSDTLLRAVDDAFLLGADLLVACQVAPGGGRPVVLPQPEWQPIDLLAARETDPDLPDLYLRPGSIVPVGVFDGELSAVRPPDVLQLLVCPDENGHARGVLYEDAGEGHGHLEGQYRVTEYTAQLDDGWLAVEGRIVDGEWGHADRPLRLTLVNGGSAVAFGEDLSAAGGQLAVPQD